MGITLLRFRLSSRYTQRHTTTAVDRWAELSTDLNTWVPSDWHIFQHLVDKTSGLVDASHALSMVVKLYTLDRFAIVELPTPRRRWIQCLKLVYVFIVASVLIRLLLLLWREQATREQANVESPSTPRRRTRSTHAPRRQRALIISHSFAVRPRPAGTAAHVPVLD